MTLKAIGENVERSLRMNDHLSFMKFELNWNLGKILGNILLVMNVTPTLEVSIIQEVGRIKNSHSADTDYTRRV